MLFDRLFMWHQFCNILYWEIRKIIQPSSSGWTNLFLYLIIGCTKHTTSNADVLCLFAVFHPSSTGIWVISGSCDSRRNTGCSLSIRNGICCIIRPLAGRKLSSWAAPCLHFHFFVLLLEDPRHLDPQSRFWCGMLSNLFLFHADVLPVLGMFLLSRDF